MPPKKQSKGVTAIKTIVRHAKAYQREHPAAKWQTAIKHGAVEYRRTHPAKK